MKTPRAIAALRNAMQTFITEYEGRTGCCLLTDLATDERAILGHPEDTFAWIITLHSTHMVRTATGEIVDFGMLQQRAVTRSLRSRREHGARFLREVCAVFEPNSPMRFYHWDGASLHEYATVDELNAAWHDGGSDVATA